MDPEGAGLLTYSLYAYGKPRLPPVHKYQYAPLRIGSRPLLWTLHYMYCTRSIVVKVQCQVLNRQRETNFDNYSLIRN